MTDSMFNPQPNYSGVTIQIANPAVNVGPGIGPGSMGNGSYISGGCSCINGYNMPNKVYNNEYLNNSNIQDKVRRDYISPGTYSSFPQNNYDNNPVIINPSDNTGLQNNQNMSGNLITPNSVQSYPNAYPAQYYLNNYNYGVNGNDNNVNNGTKKENDIQGYNNNKDNIKNISNNNFNNTESTKNSEKDNINENKMNSYKIYADKYEPQNTDMTRSNEIINDINDRMNEEQEIKKNTKETKIVALTDEYIKSLENYLNNRNDEIRIMASKEVLTRLDEDKDRYNDAALNALLNKMLQDPSKLVRIASLSAFASQLACGNDYTVKLLQNIQSNPNSDKEDVLQAADILLKMSAGVEVKNIPNPAKKNDDVKNNKKV